MTQSRRGPLWSRRRFLRFAAVGSIAVATGVAFDEVMSTLPLKPVRAPEPSPAQRWAFHSRPDLAPPVVSVARRRDAVLAPGLILLTPGNGAVPDGLMIVDDTGRPIWIHPVGNAQAANLRVATYRGQPVLTWWEGAITKGYGRGAYVIADTSYREITRVHAGGGLEADLHEFIIGPEDTGFFLISRAVEHDVAPTSGGSTTPGMVLEAVIQEVDIATGQVLFEWHSLPSIDPTESYQPLPTDGSPFDYLHANAIDLDESGGLLLCGRHTWALYRIDRAAGEITWRLNGKRSDFKVEPTAQFAWQHDARVLADGSISIFDDGSAGNPPSFETRSRGIVLTVDENARTVQLEREFIHPEGLLATSQGSFQVLAGGDGFVGWGSVPRYSEFSPSGELVLDASFAAAADSYRSLRHPWTGQPAEPPVVVIDQSGATAMAYVSWNGATEVARWDLLDASGTLDPPGPVGSASPSPTGGPPASAARTGFETGIAVPSGVAAFIVRAVDAEGIELGRTTVVEISGE
jgi:hypothetical protein